MAQIGIDYDSEISARYEHGRGLSPQARDTWRTAVAGLIPTDAPVVDVGAGTGRFTRLLAEMTAAPVIAVEPSLGMRNAARAVPSPGASWVAAPAEAMPLRSQSAGAIWTAFTTHYLELESAGREFGRVLRPGGRVLVWHAFPDVFDELEWLRWFPAARAIDEQRMPSIDTVTSAFERAGLRYVDRTDHRMHIADSFDALVERIGHRAISTLTLISDAEFDAGLSAMRKHALDNDSTAPIWTPNVLLVFESP